MAVYVDVVFLLNVMIDGIVLYMTAWSRKLRAKAWRVWLAAAVGASYALLLFFPGPPWMTAFALKFMLSLFMVWTAFGFRSLQFFAANAATFYMVNFMAAGMILGVHYMLQSPAEMMDGIIFSRTGGLAFRLQVGMAFVFLLFLVAMMLWKMFVRSMRRKEGLHQSVVNVAVHLDGETVACQGLVDTGNRLYDPVSRHPVMIMEAALWRGYLPGHWLDNLHHKRMDVLLGMIGKEPHRWQHRLRFIPCKGIGGSPQILLALRPDRVVIGSGTESCAHTKVFVALKRETLSSDGSFRAIVHPDLAQAGEPAVTHYSFRRISNAR